MVYVYTPCSWEVDIETEEEDADHDHEFKNRLS